MSATSKSLPVTSGSGGVAVPCVYDAVTDAWIPAAGNAEGAQSVQLTGSNAIVGVVDVVTTATTREQLASHACREVTIIAKDTNTGYIYIGGSDVSATVYGAKLAAKDSITLAVSNTNLIYMDASVSGEGISYVAI